jgi:chromosome segregation ATPase
MIEISELDARLTGALERLRGAIAARPAPEVDAGVDAGALGARIAELEAETERLGAELETERAEAARFADENARLAEELAELRAKRERDVASLDELITQLKPLIAEV